MISFGRDPLKAKNKAARLAAQAIKDGNEVVIVRLRSKDVMLAGSLDDAMEERGYRFDGWMSPTRAVYRQVHGYLLDSDAELLPLFKSMPGGRGRAQANEKSIDVSTPGHRHRFGWDQIDHFEMQEAGEEGVQGLVIQFEAGAGTGGYTLLIKEQAHAWCAQLKDHNIHQSKGRHKKGSSPKGLRDRDRTIESDAPSVSSGETRTDFNAIGARLRAIEERIAATERGERPSSELPDLYRLRNHLESQLP